MDPAIEWRNDFPATPLPAKTYLLVLVMVERLAQPAKDAFSHSHGRYPQLQESAARPSRFFGAAAG